MAHSLSPAIHNAAFASTGIDCTYGAVRVAVGEVPAAVRRMRDERWLGMSVTMPHKESVVDELDGVTDIAGRLGAVNCVYWADDRLVGDNTDGAGVVWALTSHLGLGDVRRRVAVLGAGGAARACVAALAAAGATEIVIVNRTPARAEAAALLAPGVARVGAPADVEGVDVVINATPVGMGDTASADDGAVRHVPGPGVVAMDLIYHPAETAWLAACRRNGATVANGVPMLVGQAAAAFERWTGVEAPIGAMRGAVEAELAARG